MQDSKDRITWTISGLICLLSVILITTRSLVSKESSLGEVFQSLNPTRFPNDEKALAEFLLLMPVATTLICFSRIVIGIATFGTFTPALLALAFREIRSWKAILISLIVFGVIWIIGCSFRRAIHSLNLLQVPRSSIMLTMIVIMLLIFLFFCQNVGVQAKQYLPLLPLVILTGMLERYWILDQEQGSFASFRTLIDTLMIALGIRLLFEVGAIHRWMMGYPETIGILISIQLILGRYMGYRLLELRRFRILSEGSS